MMSPASMSWARYMVVTPAYSSPLSTDHCMGAAPRYLGSSEPCTFTAPSRGIASIASGSILPYATTHSTSGARERISSRASSVRTLSG